MAAMVANELNRDRKQGFGSDSRERARLGRGYQFFLRADEIFKPFVSSKAAGMEMGLAISRSIMRNSRRQAMVGAE